MNNPPDHKGILSRSISPSPSRHYLDSGTHNIHRTIFFFSLVKLKHFNHQFVISVTCRVFVTFNNQERVCLFVVFYFDCSTIESLCGWFPLVTEIDVGLDVMAKVIQCTLLLRSFILLLSAKV